MPEPRHWRDAAMPRVRWRAAPPTDPTIPLALPIHAGAPPPEKLRAAALAAGFRGGTAAAVTLWRPQGCRLLVGLGAGGEGAAEQAGGAAAVQAGAPRLAIDARGLPVAAATSLAAGACLRAWRLDRLRQPPEPAPRTQALGIIDLIVDDPVAAAAAWPAKAAGVRGALFARELVAEPANRLTPAVFAARLEALAEHGIAVDVLGRKRLERAGCGGLLAAGRAARHPPRLVVLRWRGSFAAPPVAFVGKGLCFDAGGLAIKPAEGMAAMRGDMAGAAACAGAMLALALRRSPTPALAVLALAENLPGAAAYRRGDVLRMRSGRTVEVVDPDAEGRLVLADAIAQATSYGRPRALIDLGTLTGAAVVALGHARGALFGNDATLRTRLLAAGDAVAEPLWPLPIGAGHRADLRSDIADLRQCATGRGQPDACHAAAFLEAFVPAGLAWAHLDIAGVADAAEPTALAAKGPTGFGARLLDRLVADGFETWDDA